MDFALAGYVVLLYCYMDSAVAGYVVSAVMALWTLMGLLCCTGYVDSEVLAMFSLLCSLY